MEPILYVLAIMGCGDDAAQCKQARIEPAHYTSVQACQAAMPDALSRNSDLEFPVLTAACRREGAQMVQASAARERNGG